MRDHDPGYQHGFRADAAFALAGRDGMVSRKPENGHFFETAIFETAISVAEILFKFELVPSTTTLSY
jgi:hypothetical protein